MTVGNVRYMTGDLFDTTMPAIGHGVNTQGAMGAGVAKLVRAHYPEVYRIYREVCASAGGLQPGQMLPVQGPTGNWVLNLASQQQLGADARLDWLEASFRTACGFCDAKQLEGFAIPRIGAGIGGLAWEDVREVIERVADRYPRITVEVWSLA